VLAAAAHGHHHDAPTDTLQQEALAASPGCCRMITLVAMRTGWGPMVEQMHTRAGRLQRSQIVRRPLMCSVCWVFMSSATIAAGPAARQPVHGRQEIGSLLPVLAPAGTRYLVLP
jgi:hypothetical protein